MNIFYLDPNPITCAEYHCDQHCVKMILETAQLLSTAHHVNGDSTLPELYKATHINHPTSVWVRSSVDHYLWAYSLFTELLAEFEHRRNKVHASSRLKKSLAQVPSIPDNGFIAPPQCMPDEYKIVGDTVGAYKKYYVGDKSRFATWNWGRAIPKWFSA